MQFYFLVLLFVAVANCAIPKNYVEIGHYGINYGTRKTYYYSGTLQATGDNHAALCIAAGLEPLHLASVEEQYYFLNVYRSVTTVELPHSHIGAARNGVDFVWRKTQEMITFPIHWYRTYPNTGATHNCLMVANRPEDGGTAIFNHPCTVSSMYPFICQKVGG